MSLATLKSVERASYDLISVDIFDTLLLRDRSAQRGRFRDVARVLSKKLAEAGRPVSTSDLLSLRKQVHRAAYQAVALERPTGDASLSTMIDMQITLLGLDVSFAGMFRAAELEVESRRLSPNIPLIKLLFELHGAGKRAIAISDMYLSREDIAYLVGQVIGPSPVDRLYVSCDLGTTKHSGRIFQEVSRQEAVPLARILHCGDNRPADFVAPRAAGCQAVLLPPPAAMQVLRKLSAIPLMMTR